MRRCIMLLLGAGLALVFCPRGSPSSRPRRSSGCTCRPSPRWSRGVTSRALGVRGSLDRDEVLALRVDRREVAERRQREREARKRRPPPVATVQPPDDEHVWLRSSWAARSWVSPKLRSPSVPDAVGCRSSSIRVGGGSGAITWNW